MRAFASADQPAYYPDSRYFGCILHVTNISICLIIFPRHLSYINNDDEQVILFPQTSPNRHSASNTATMRLTNLLPFALSLLPLISSKSYCPPQPACEADQIVIWNEFVDVLWIKKNVSLAFNTHVDVNYIQHNPFATSGRQPAIDFLTALWPLDNFTIMHNGFYNNTGYLHYRVDSAGQYPEAITDILRFQSWSPNYTNPLALF
jgi:predicted SnoaL-like aldol condensation-catalyzing enzyme